MEVLHPSTRRFRGIHSSLLELPSGQQERGAEIPPAGKAGSLREDRFSVRPANAPTPPDLRGFSRFSFSRRTDFQSVRFRRTRRGRFAKPSYEANQRRVSFTKGVAARSLPAVPAVWFPVAGDDSVRKQCIKDDDVFLIHDFLSPEECTHFIARGEEAGFDEAPITTAAGPVMRKGIRDNSRAMIDDHALAAQFFDRARPFLPECLLSRWRLLGFNERWRYYRYDPGEKFAPHYDGSFVRSDDEKSQLTFMIYLNDGFTGGETNFYFIRDEPAFSVKPQRGAALVFVHWKLHEGAPVVTGRKYVLRTDILYRRIESQAHE
jgi:prolyl 4-hydroxylase